MMTAGLGTAPTASAHAATPYVAAASVTPSTASTTAAGRSARPAARRAASLRPTAIGVDRRGTSYVGFVSGGAIARIGVDAQRRRAVPLDRDGAVVGLHVTAHGSVWVAYADSVSLLRHNGHVSQHFATGACPDGTARDAARYGGIAATPYAVYVADPCAPRLLVFAPDGHHRTTVRLPGTRPARGLAYAAGGRGHGPRLYVTLPDRALLLAYRLHRDRPGRHPADRVPVRRPRGGRRAAPEGVTVDRFGQVVVADAANNALYFLDSTNHYALYRTLGHPPRRSHRAGRLSHPTALAQHAQDGGGLSGNLFIADSDNYRIQRWDTGGYTHWTKHVRAPRGGGGGGGGGGSGGGGGGSGGGSGAVPVSYDSDPPVVVGTPEPGEPISCSHGGWSGSPTSYSYGWLRDGAVVVGGTDGVFGVTEADRGHRLACRVRATNDAGTSAWALSEPVDVS